MMIRRGTWVMLGVLLLLVVAAWLLLGSNNDPQPQATSQPTEAAFSDWSPAEVGRIEVEAGGQSRLILERRPDSSWQRTYPGSGLVSSMELEQSLQNLAATSILQTLDAGADRSEFGLAPPQYLFLFDLSQEQVKSLAIGKQTPVGSGYYVLVDGGPVQVASSGGLTRLVELIELILNAEQPGSTSTSTRSP